MGIGQILGPIGRRWYLLVLGLLLTGGLTFAGLTLTPPTYEASGSVLLLPSREQMASGGRNPFLQLGNLDAPASIVIARLNGDETHNIIEAASPTAEYFVENDPTMRGPAIQVTVTDRTGESTLVILNQLLDLVGESLAGVQAEREVPNAAVVGSMRLVVDTEAERLSSDTMRTTIAALGVGLAATALLVFTADALILRRRQRRLEEPGKPAGGPVEPTVEAPVRTKIQKSRPPAERTKVRATRAADDPTGTSPATATAADPADQGDPDQPDEPSPTTASTEASSQPGAVDQAGEIAAEEPGPDREPEDATTTEAAPDHGPDDRSDAAAPAEPEDQAAAEPTEIRAGRVL